MKSRIRYAIAVAAGLAILASCNFPSPPSPQEVAQTAAAETVSAQLTLVSLATPTVPASNTPAPPTPTETPIPSPQPTATAGCSDASQFISDVTIPDNTLMTPGQSFTKTWRLRNSGNCDWTTAFDAVFTDGSSMGGPAAVPLAGTVPPNSTVDITINLTAPTTNGVHRGNYRMRNANDVLFGTLFYVQIIVGPTPTATVVVYRTGKVTIDNSYAADLDAGTITGDPDRDVWLHAVSAVERYLEPKNGALLKKMSGVPGYTDCRDATLESGPINFTDFAVGSKFCYKTSAGRFGSFEVEDINPSSVRLDFRTWN